jgi:hypothetical protein
MAMTSREVAVRFPQRQSERQEDEDRFTASLAGFAVALVLGIIGLWVVGKLATQSKLEDCLLQGRMNCERVELSPQR